MPSVIKPDWFGKRVSVLLINGKTLTGELAQVTDDYIVVSVGEAENLVMVHAIIAVRLAGEE